MDLLLRKLVQLEEDKVSDHFKGKNRQSAWFKEEEVPDRMVNLNEHGSHIDVKVLLQFRINNVFLPAYFSRSLQPLDLGPFSHAKGKYRCCIADLHLDDVVSVMKR